MNTTMADGAEQRLDAQIAEALFGQPGMSKMDVANRVRELRGDGPALLVGGSHGSEVQVADGPWPEIDAILADAYSAGAVGLPFGGIARRAAVRAAIAAKTSRQSEYLHGSDELRARVAGERAAYLEGLEEGKKIAARQPVEQNWQHIANEWADAATNGVQWLRNIRDGASTLADALACMESNVERIQQLKPPAQAVDLGPGIKAIGAERERQLQAEGFTRDGDQQYRRGELAKAATAYVQLAAMDLEAGGRNHIAWHGPAAVWPWAPEWWKPVDARRDLVRAGALIAAQIDLIDGKAVDK